MTDRYNALTVALEDDIEDQNFSLSFFQGNEQIGTLEFNGQAMTFSGNAEDSARVFFDWTSEYFARRLDEERKSVREACAKMCDEAAANTDINSRCSLRDAYSSMAELLRSTQN